MKDIEKNSSIILQQNFPPISMSIADRRDNSEKLMLTAFITMFTLLFVIIILAKYVCLNKSIQVIHQCDFLPITNGNQKHYAGGVITILYVVTLMIMMSGVTLKYLYFNERVENSQISGFETLQYPQSSIIIRLNIHATVYSNRSIDLCDVYMQTYSSINQHKFKTSCTLVDIEESAVSMKRKIKVATN